jgi:hypothetical protein
MTVARPSRGWTALRATALFAILVTSPSERAFCASAGHDLDWTTASLADGAFSASFPAPPTARAVKGPGRLWSASARGEMYLALMSPGIVASPGLARALVGALNGRLVAEKVEGFRGAALAVRFWFRLDRRAGAGVLASTADRTFALLVLSTAASAEDPSAGRFVGSLAIPASAKAGEALQEAGETSANVPSPASPLETRLAETLQANLKTRQGLEALAAAPIAASPMPPVADASDYVGVPDPHADLGEEHPAPTAPAMPAPAPAASAPVPPPPAAPNYAAPTYAAAPAPPEVSPPAYTFPPPPRWVWLPAAWRWTGSSWQWLPGHWDRLRDD